MRLHPFLIILHFFQFRGCNIVPYMVYYICTEEVLGKKEEKMKVKIYQLGLESGYTFMNYEYAKDVLEMEDYELVAEFNLNSQYDEQQALDIIYLMGNDGQLAMKFKMRSISVSDIIELDETKYYVDSFGFKQI